MNLYMRLIKFTSLSLVCLFAASAPAYSAWPDQPVSFIVPFPPGGPVDTTARLTTLPLLLGLHWT